MNNTLDCTDEFVDEYIDAGKGIFISGDSSIDKEVSENVRKDELHSTLNESFGEDFPPNQEKLYTSHREDETEVLKGEITFLKIELEKKQAIIEQKKIAINMKIVEVEREKMEKQEREKEILKMKDEVKNINVNYDSLESVKQGLDNKVKRLEEERSKYSACIRGLRKEVKDAKSYSGVNASKESQKKISDLKQQLRKCREEKRTHMSNLEDVQTTVDMTDAEENNVKVNKKLAEKDKETNKLKSEIKSVEKRNKELVVTINDLNKKISDLNIENNTLKATNKRNEEAGRADNTPKEQPTGKAPEKDKSNQKKLHKEKAELTPHSSGVICKWENSKLCFMKNKCKDIHLKSTCPSHSKYCKCQAPT